MPIENISQLTPEMQAAVPGAPGVPAPVLPIQSAMPDQQAAPDQQPAGVPAGPIVPIGAPPTPATSSSPTVNAIHDGINQAAAATPPAQRGKPGLWATQILAGLSHAFSNVQTGLGDMAAANVAEGNHGILGGIGAVQNAKNARLQAEQKAQDEHDRNFALTAKTNADFYHQQILNHRESGDYSDKINNEAIQTGKQAVDAATLNATDAGLDPSKIIHSNITEQQKLNLLVSKNWDPTLHTVWETASQPVIDPATGEQKVDKDGSKQFQKMYTIIDTPEKIVLNADSAALLNKYLHTDFKDGQELPGGLGLSQFQMAANSHALQANRDAQLAKIDESAANAQQKLAMDKAQENLGTEFLQVVSGLPNVSDQMKFVSGQHLIPDPTGKNPNGIVDPRSADYFQKHPNAPNDLVDSYGGKAKFQALVLNEAKEADQQRRDDEKERHDRAEEDRALKAEQDKKTADLNDQTDAFGNKSPLSDKEFNKRYDAFTGSAQNKTVQTLAGSYQQFNSILNDVNAGKMTPADSVVGLLAAIGISATPLAGKGFRINSNIIDEHVGAQQGGPGAGKLRQLSTGDILSAQQLQDYARIAADVYKQSYLNAANEQRRTLGYVDILPRGNNQQIDPMTASMYLQIAGNNPQLAAQAAQKQGWQVTPQSFGAQKGIPGLPPGAIAARSNNGAGPVVGYMLNGKYVSLGAQ